MARNLKNNIKRTDWARYIVFSALVIFSATLFWLLPQSWSWPATHGAGFTLYFFDVGQGDSALVQCGRTQALIDGGPTRSVLRKIGRAMPFTDRRVEYIFLSHPHSDHYFGLFEVLERYEVGYLVMSHYSATSQIGRQLVELAQEHDTPVLVAAAEDTFSLGECGRLVALWPDEHSEHIAASGHDWQNDLSLVLELRSSDDRSLALFTGDINAAVERELISRRKVHQVRVLKAPHHGSRYSSSAHFLRVLSPSHAIISVGQNNYGQPGGVVLMRLQKSNTKVHRTDQQGDAGFMINDDEQMVPIGALEF